jgi:hypothetical protein
MLAWLGCILSNEMPSTGKADIGTLDFMLPKAGIVE